LPTKRVIILKFLMSKLVINNENDNNGNNVDDARVTVLITFKINYISRQEPREQEEGSQRIEHSTLFLSVERYEYWIFPRPRNQ